MDNATAAKPTFMEAARAGAVLRDTLDPKAQVTVADAAARSGLALRDAEAGLTWLSSEYRGQLRVTGDGELVHLFPTGFARPWEAGDARRRLLRRVGHAAMGAVRLIVRAWVAVVLVGYAALFVAILIGLTFAQQGGDSRRREGGLPGGALGYALLRIVGDALFWTFHPWSPFAVYGASGGWGGGYGERMRAAPARRGEPKVPLYERVNRFFFGPTAPPDDPLEQQRVILAAIRAGKGRIGLADVMRATGLPREQADPMMARLMLDYEGDVDVSEDGGIVYRFEKLRKSAAESGSPEPPPAWTRQRPLLPLTGNSMGSNLAIAGLNAFNLFMGAWSIENGMTIERVTHLFDRAPYHVLGTGTPIALGVVPLVFSALLFVLPLARAVVRPAKVREATREKGRLAVLRAVLERVRGRQPVTDEIVTEAWKRATGEPPERKRIDQELVALGGGVDIQESGQVRWRFADLETEAAAVQAEREAAPEAEAKLGAIVYSTDEH